MSTSDDIRAFNERVSAAMAAQDAVALADCYTDDARLLLAGQPMIRGRDAIAALFEMSLAQGPHHMRFESTDVWEAGNDRCRRRHDRDAARNEQVRRRARATARRLAQDGRRRRDVRRRRLDARDEHVLEVLARATAGAAVDVPLVALLEHEARPRRGSPGRGRAGR